MVATNGAIATLLFAFGDATVDLTTPYGKAVTPTSEGYAHNQDDTRPCSRLLPTRPARVDISKGLMGGGLGWFIAGMIVTHIFVHDKFDTASTVFVVFVAFVGGAVKFLLELGVTTACSAPSPHRAGLVRRT